MFPQVPLWLSTGLKLIDNSDDKTHRVYMPFVRLNIVIIQFFIKLTGFTITQNFVKY